MNSFILNSINKNIPIAGNDIKLAGNAPANLSTTGLTILSAVSGVDDIGITFPVPMNFYFFGTNYGAGLTFSLQKYFGFFS